MGLTMDDILQLLKNGYLYASLPETEKQDYIKKLEQAWHLFFSYS